MTDPGPLAPIVSTRCPWCSAQVTPEATTCPSCGARIREEAAADIPGVTHLDPAASVVRPQPRGRGFMGWLSGEVDTTETDVDRAGIEPPTDAVRQEMLRLEMEALRAEIEAEAAAQAVADSEGRAIALVTPAPLVADAAPALADADPALADVPASGDGAPES